jgi:hypothetical protein
VLPLAIVTFMGLWFWTVISVFMITEGSMKVAMLPLSIKDKNLRFPIVTNKGNVFAFDDVLDRACIEIYRAGEESLS